MAANKVTVTVEGLKNLLPEFNNNNYSYEYLQSCINQALDIIPADNYGALKDKLRQDAIYYMAAHLLTLRQRAMSGKGGSATGQVQSSSVGGVSVSFAAAPNSDQSQYWLNQTIYGQMYLVLIRKAKTGGFYIGGSMEAVLR